MAALHFLPAPTLASLLALVSMPLLSSPVSEAQSAVMAGKYEQAVSVLRPAAARGDPRAQYVLGNMYRQGWGVTADASMAALWYERSAVQGDVDAQVALGEMHYAGQGVPKDHKKALDWFRRASITGKSEAPTPQYILGSMLRTGEGVTRDPVSAYMWLNIASINAVAEETRKRYREAMDGVGSSLSPSDLQLAHSRVRQCLASNYVRC